MKNQYFQRLLDDVKEKNSDMFEASIYDKLVEVDRVAKDVFKDVLEKKPGLMAKGGRMEPFQFGEGNTITNEMIGDKAVQDAKEQARNPNHSFRTDKDASDPKNQDNSLSNQGN